MKGSGISANVPPLRRSHPGRSQAKCAMALPSSGGIGRAPRSHRETVPTLMRCSPSLRASASPDCDRPRRLRAARS